MKHGIRKLALVLVLALLLSTAALAAGATVEIKDVATGGSVAFHEGSTTQLTVKKSDAQEGGMYLVLVLAGKEDDGKPLVPTAKNILYINQTTATEDGPVTFDNVYPSAIKDSTVYLSGTGLTGLTKMGEIELLVQYGDINEDEIINVTDVLILLRYISNLPNDTFTENQKTAANVSGDDVINATDALLILKYIAGNIFAFPVEG